MWPLPRRLCVATPSPRRGVRAPALLARTDQSRPHPPSHNWHVPTRWPIVGRVRRAKLSLRRRKGPPCYAAIMCNSAGPDSMPLRGIEPAPCTGMTSHGSVVRRMPSPNRAVRRTTGPISRPVWSMETLHVRNNEWRRDGRARSGWAVQVGPKKNLSGKQNGASPSDFISSYSWDLDNGREEACWLRFDRVGRIVPVVRRPCASHP